MALSNGGFALPPAQHTAGWLARWYSRAEQWHRNTIDGAEAADIRERNGVPTPVGFAPHRPGSAARCRDRAEAARARAAYFAALPPDQMVGTIEVAEAAFSARPEWLDRTA